MGYVQVPYLADTKIKVTFDNIKINSERQLFDGKIVTTYDKTEKNVVKADLKKQFEKVSEGIKALAQKKKEETEAIFGEQGEEFEKELQQWAVEEQKKQDEFNELEKQFAISQEINEQKNSNIIPNKNENKEQISVKKQEKENNIASTGKLYLEHKDKKYYDGDILKLPFKRRMNEHFTLKSLQDSTKVNWKLYNRSGEKTIAEEYFNLQNRINAKIFNLNETNTKNSLLIGIEAEAQIEGKPKVEIVVEKEVKPFKFNELKAIDDNNPKRVAKSGETLYYVHTPQKITEKSENVSIDLDKKYTFDVPVLKQKRDARYTKFQMEISPQIPIDEIPENYIEWNFNGTNLNHYELSLSRNVTYDKNIEVLARTGNPMAGEHKKVKVQWVERKFSAKNLTNKLDNFFKVFNILNKISGTIGKGLPCKATFRKDIQRNLTWQWTTENKEDNNSRHILQENKFKFILSADNLANLKCGKELGISVFGKSFELGELYAEINIGANIGIENTEIFYLETNKLQSKTKKGVGGIEIKGEVGLTLGGGYKENGKVIIGAYGGGKVNITGGGKIEYPYNEDTYKMGANAYINPVMYNFTAEVKLGPLSKELSYSGILIDTRTESDPIIIDLK